MRPREGRIIGGVCAAIAQSYGWDLALVRIVLVVFTCLTSGMGILIYLAAWLLIPDAPYRLSASTPQRSAN
jgi:phage shock protein C